MSEMDTLDFRLLGMLEIVKDGQVVRFRGGRPRELLLLLLLHRNHAVTAEQLAAGLWGDARPRTAASSIQVFVHAAREGLGGRRGGGQLLMTRPGGYQLTVPAGQVDVDRFARLADQARTDHAAQRLERAWDGYAAALELWRGPALADVADRPFAQPEIVRLERRRLAAVEAQLRVGLELGRHRELVGELEAQVRAHPQHEPLHALLMLGLYRSGRLAEALVAYQTARGMLADQLGPQPSAQLEQLQRAILTQDPSLDHRSLDHRPMHPHLGEPATRPGPVPSRTVPARGPSAPSPVPPATTEERKTVTIMVAGSIAAGDGSRDPEDVREHTAAALALIGEYVRRYGGSVSALVAGRLLAVFGAPRSRTDDPERAVRAALSACADGLPVRFGIATGDVVVTVSADKQPGEDAVPSAIAGDAVSAAAALEALAPAGGVVAGSGTYRATRRAITYRPLAAASDVEQTMGTAAWQALAPRARTGAQVADPTASPLIERDSELTLFGDLLTRSLRDRKPQLLTLVSEPGLGKTRLVDELGGLVDHAPELVSWRVGHSPPYGAGSFFALAEIVKAHVGILDTDPAPVVEDKLRGAVTEVIDDAAHAETVLDCLQALTTPSQVAPHTTEPQPQELTDGWSEFLAAAAARRPTVVVFEDLQWADGNLLDFIDRLAERAGPVPLLIVATARPELLDRRPGWGGGKPDAATIALSPLSREGTDKLLDALHTGEAFPPVTRELLLTAADGNPLYVEEYVSMLREQDRGHAGAAPLPIPETIQQVIAARIDLLDTHDKRLLRDAAVIGETGWVGALAAVGEWEPSQVQDRLRSLEHRRLLRRIRVSSVPGETEYTFGHALVHDVAYAQVLRADRAVKHERAARWTERLNPGQAGERIEAVAYHYRQALESARAAGQRAQGLVERTREALVAAGDQAMTLGALRAASRHFQHALDLCPETDPERAGMLLRLGTALTFAEHAGEQVLLQARDLLAAAGHTARVAEADTLLGVLAGLRGEGDASSLMARARAGQPEPTAGTTVAYGYQVAELLFGDQPRAAIRAAEDLLARIDGRGFNDQEGMLLTVIGDSMLLLGDAHGEAETSRGIAMVAAARHPLIGKVRWGLAWFSWWAGLLDRCAAALEDTRRAVRDDPPTLLWVDAVGAGLDYAAGRWDAAAAAVDTLVANPAEHGMILPWAHTFRGRVRLGRGDTAGAAAAADAAIEAAANLPGDRRRQFAAALHCRAMLAAGRRGQAAGEADALLADLHANPDGSFAAPDLGIVLAELGCPADSLPAGLAPTAWHGAVRALVAGDVEEAARRYAALGSPADAADVRRHAARRGPSTPTPVPSGPDAVPSGT